VVGGEGWWVGVWGGDAVSCPGGKGSAQHPLRTDTRRRHEDSHTRAAYDSHPCACRVPAAVWRTGYLLRLAAKPPPARSQPEVSRLVHFLGSLPAFANAPVVSPSASIFNRLYPPDVPTPCMGMGLLLQAVAAFCHARCRVLGLHECTGGQSLSGRCTSSSHPFTAPPPPTNQPRTAPCSPSSYPPPPPPQDTATTTAASPPHAGAACMHGTGHIEYPPSPSPAAALHCPAPNLWRPLPPQHSTNCGTKSEHRSMTTPSPPSSSPSSSLSPPSSSPSFSLSPPSSSLSPHPLTRPPACPPVLDHAPPPCRSCVWSCRTSCGPPRSRRARCWWRRAASPPPCSSWSRARPACSGAHACMCRVGRSP
jgi:hypothetical protein